VNPLACSFAKLIPYNATIVEVQTCPILKSKPEIKLNEC
jgi:hypothetical protein